MQRPLVIAHRGASGYRPEHTIAAYRLAIEQGADYIEPDLVPTRDGVLIARHESELAGTTTAAPGTRAESLSWDEVLALRARERIPDIRPSNTAFDGRFHVPRIEEIVALAREHDVGVYPEIKSPAFFASIGFDLGRMLVDVLARERFERAYVQSFEPDSLRALQGCGYPLVQLMKAPMDLREVAKYAQAIGPWKDLPGIHDCIREARALGLDVHPWTLRSEPAFQREGRSFEAEIDELLDAGATGAFFDQPDLGVAAVDRFMRSAGRIRDAAATG